MLIEKLMSGLWLGDCARRHLLTFAKEAQLFGDGPVPEKLLDPAAFTTAHLSAIESDASPLRGCALRVFVCGAAGSACGLADAACCAALALRHADHPA